MMQALYPRLMEDGTKQHSFDKSGTPLNNTILIEKEDFASESTDWLNTNGN